MDSRTFFQHVDKQKAVLLAAHAERKRKFETTGDDDAWQGQPADGHHVFIVSKDNLDKGTLAGRVVESPVRLASQRIIEQTHEIATKTQIDEHHAYQASEKRRLAAIDQERKQQFVVNVPAAGIQQVDSTSPVFKAAVEEAVKGIMERLAAGTLVNQSASNEKKAVGATKVPVPLTKSE